MRVLLATPGTELGGTERVVIALAHALTGRGHELVLWGPAGVLEPELGGVPLDRVVVPNRERSAVGLAEGASFAKGSEQLIVSYYNFIGET